MSENQSNTGTMELPEDKWLLVNQESGKVRPFDNRSRAEDGKRSLEGLGADVELYAPGEHPDLQTEDETAEEAADELLEDTADAEEATGVTETVPAEESEFTAAQEESADDVAVPTPSAYDEDLPNKPRVDEDPLVWMPSEFTDEIDGTMAINRKGYEVLAHYYGIQTRSDCLVGPEETEHEYARHKAVAITADGKRYEAHGSAHVDRGDDKTLLLSMSDTRARKRAVAQATGVGMVAVSELKAAERGENNE